MRKNILIISTYYPPIQSIATNRIYSFAKYLNEFGYFVTILTCSNNGKDTESIENGIKVVRLKQRDFLKKANTNVNEHKLLHYLKCIYNLILMNFIVDEAKGWTQYAILKAEHLMKEHNYDYVLSSAPPIGPHIVALKLKKDNSKIKWIADMRDALSWSENYPDYIRKKLKSFETIFLKNCDGVLSVSKPQLLRYQENASKDICFAEIRNGYDFDAKFYQKETQIFSIIYAGSFYGERKPDNFFIALSNVLKKYSIKINVRIIGNKAPIRIPSDIRESISIEKSMDYNELIYELQRKCNLLLLISPSSLEKGIYTGKLFDYLGACTPILGLVPKDDVAADLIKEANSGYIVENESIEEIERTILQAYHDWKNNKRFAPNYHVIKEHHRRNQTRRLSVFMEHTWASM